MPSKFSPEVSNSEGYMPRVVMSGSVRLLLHELQSTDAHTEVDAMRAGLLGEESLQEPSLQTFGELPLARGKSAE
jgi:hypothetical protein